MADATARRLIWPKLRPKPWTLAKDAGEWEIELYTSEALASGQHANNPWLQELPDPITKATWDNYVCMAPEDLSALTGKSFKDLYIGQESPANLVKGHGERRGHGTARVMLSPGQAPKTIAVASATVAVRTVASAWDVPPACATRTASPAPWAATPTRGRRAWPCRAL
jgi:hypothetical protein